MDTMNLVLIIGGTMLSASYGTTVGVRAVNGGRVYAAQVLMFAAGITAIVSGFIV